MPIEMEKWKGGAIIPAYEYKICSNVGAVCAGAAIFRYGTGYNNETSSEADPLRQELGRSDR